MGLTLEILQSQLLSPNPLVISLQFTEKFHNWIKYVQWVLVDALTPPSPVVPPFLVAQLPLEFPLPLVKLMSGVIVPPLGATIPLVIKHNWETNIMTNLQFESHGHT
jgi:hypothetical protein